MSTSEALIGGAMFGWAPFGCLVVGFLYFLASGKAARLSGRVLAASYAPLAAFIYLAIAFAIPGTRSLGSIPVYVGVHLIPLALLVLALRLYPGPRWVHAVLVPIALLCMLWQFVWGYFHVFGK